MAPLHYDKIRVDEKTGCWEWQGRLKKGYGPHRRWYEHLRNPIEKGMTLDHLCRNIICVNPDHVEPVTMAENLRRGIRDHQGTWGRPKIAMGDRTGCGKHGLDDGYFKKRSDGYEAYVCRTCSRKRLQDWRERKRSTK